MIPLWKQIENALHEIASNGPEEALKQDEFGNLILDTIYIEDDEINLTNIAKAVAEALEKAKAA